MRVSYVAERSSLKFFKSIWFNFALLYFLIYWLSNLASPFSTNQIQKKTDCKRFPCTFRELWLVHWSD